MTKTLVISTLVATALLTTTLSAKEGKNKKAQEYKQEKKLAKKAIKGLVKEFQKDFKKAIKKDGPAGAVDFCSQKASEITENYNKNLKNITIKRVTLKPRNPKDQANESETAVLTSLEALQENNVVLPKILIQKVDKKHIRVYKPILVKAKCLICHGTEDKLNPKAKEAIKAKYPNDKATGYKAGDLRGAFVVDIVKK
jgi:hypothetical protein